MSKVEINKMLLTMKVNSTIRSLGGYNLGVAHWQLPVESRRSVDDEPLDDVDNQ